MTWHAGEVHKSYHQQSFSTVAGSSEVAADGYAEANPASVTMVTSSSGAASVQTYDNTCGSYRVAMPADIQQFATEDDYQVFLQNQYDVSRLRIANSSPARRIRLKVVRGPSTAGSTLWGELVPTDAAGFPLGVASEQNARWGSGGDTSEPDAFFACYTNIAVSAGETRDVLLKLVSQNWGKKPFTRMQCQDLGTWEGDAHEQLFLQSSSGQGEHFTHQVVTGCTLGDLKGVDSGRWNDSVTWRGNCGGGEFFKLGSTRPESQGMVYHKAGPNFFDYTMTGGSKDGLYKCDVRVIQIPFNDITRVFYKVRCDIYSTINQGYLPTNLRLFALGDEIYYPYQYTNLAYTDQSGGIAVQSAASQFNCIPIGGTTPWVCEYPSTVDVLSGCRGFLVRSYQAKINGVQNNSPAITLGPNWRVSLVPYTSATSLSAGDYFEFEIEVVAFGGSWSNYDQMLPEATAFAPGMPSVTANYGTKIADFPAKVDIGPDGYADFTVTGGRDMIPIEIGGFSSYTNDTASDLRLEELLGGVWVPIDQSVAGRDWWQTEYDPASGQYSFVLDLLTDGSTRRFRVSQLLNKTEMERYASASSGVTTFAFPAHVGGSYISGPSKSPIWGGQWVEYTLNNLSGSSRKFTPFVRYSSVASASIHIEVNGVNQTGSIALASTGGAAVWKTLAGADVVLAAGADVVLAAGANTVRVVFDMGGCYLDWIEYRLERPTTSAVDDAVAAFDSVPFDVEANVPIANSITMRNTGTSTWVSAGGQYGLASDSEFGTATWYPITSDVPPGGSYTFAFTEASPSLAVNFFHTRWQMKKQGTGYFGTPVVHPQKTTDFTKTYGSSRLVADDIPVMMGAGEGRMLAITLRNLGTTTWTGSNSGDTYALVRSDGVFGTPGSGSNLNASELIAPGGQRTFYVYVTAPLQQGVYTLRLRMSHVSGGAFGPFIARQIEVVQDATPPTNITVTDDGVYTKVSTSLHATWSTSSDPESGVAEYQYAIGTTPTDPVSGYVVGWTSTGTTRSVTNTGLSLTSGITYYFYVAAKNSAGMWSNLGVSNGIVVVQDVSQVSDLKTLGVGAGFALTGKVVAGVASGLVFVEEPNRTCGIKVNWTGAAPNSTKLVTVSGIYRGIIDNEPTADALAISSGASGSASAVGMSNRSIGWQGAGTPAYAGVDTRCLLVKAWGKVTYTDSSFFLVDDGTGVADYEALTGKKGIKVTLPTGATAPLVGKVVAVTGVSRASADGSRWIMPRFSLDIQAVN
ncbi:MAG: hypothetical protein ACYC64_08930 [Armatimonadota bacterium]